MTTPTSRWIVAIYRVGVRVSPRRFRARSRGDLESDASQLVHEHGPARASVQLIDVRPQGAAAANTNTNTNTNTNANTNTNTNTNTKTTP